VKIDRSPVHVLVGLIGDADGRLLVGRRRPGQELPGYWEFPGGKRATSEEPRSALRRELAEELGIELLDAEPFMQLAHDYPQRRVWLDVWRVLRYRGRVTACEGQELAWVAACDLPGLNLLPADRPIVAALAAAPLSTDRE
jgi:8-oxo-dGTP diphosphatase